MTHLAATFSQNQYGPNGELLEAATGYVRLLRPRFRWEVAAPYPQIIVADGGELKVYDPDLEQVTVRPLEEALDNTPLALLTRTTLSVKEDYQVALLGNGTFSLRPNADTALVSEIILTFSDETLEGIAIRDPVGHRTDIRFSRFLDASVIQSDDFRLDLPPGVEVF